MLMLLLDTRCWMLDARYQMLDARYIWQILEKACHAEEEAGGAVKMPLSR